MEQKLPTETIELPSSEYKGMIYSESNPLSSGKIEMKYMTAAEEDLLTNASYIHDGTVLDRVLKSMIISKINYDDLITGDKNAIMVAARILGFGKNYEFEYDGVQQNIDLTKVENKKLDLTKIKNIGLNKFEYILPQTNEKIVYKILTHADEKLIQEELKGFKKINKNDSREVSTRLKHMIISVNDDEDKKNIREFVDKYLIAQDSRALRKHIKETQPDIDLTFLDENGNKTEIPISIRFFWPDF